MSDFNSRLAAPASQRDNEGVEVFWGLSLIRKLVSDRENVVVSPEAFYLNGFIHDLFSEYKEFSVVRTKPGGVILAFPRATGRYYPAFIMYDAADDPNQVVTIFVNDERKGVAVAKMHDNRSYVFVLSEPCEFDWKTLITLMTPNDPGGRYRIEKILLLKKKPPKMERKFLFTDVKAAPIRFGDKVDVRVTWITNWATTSRVEYGLSAKYGYSVEDNEILNNHRVILSGLERDRTYHFRLVGRTPEGVEVISEDYTFTTSPKKPSGRGVERKSIPLYVRNELEFPREGWPVTSGIPFPKGVLFSPANVRIIDPEGVEVPVQTLALSFWGDGSIRWLLIDFQADVKPRSTSEYRLEFGWKVVRKAQPSQRITLTRKKNLLEVNTGPMKILFDSERPAFPCHVWLDLDGDGEFSGSEKVINAGSIELIDAYGKTYSSLNGPCKIEVEEAGPLKTVIKIVGEHRSKDGNNLFAYVTRVIAYAGKSFLRILHTYENNNLDSLFTRIRSLILKTGVAVENPLCKILGEKEIYESSGEPLLFQRFDDEYIIVDDGSVKSRGGKADGLISLSDERCGLTVVVRDFWQNYPKTLGVEGNNVIVGICPPIPENLYPPSKELEDKLYYYLLNGEYKLKQGISKTHELLYYFHKGYLEPIFLRGLAKLFQEPLLATASPQWYCKSKVFGDLAVSDEVKFPYYERMVEKAFEEYMRRRRDGKEYGMLNFGDWWGERRFNWGNMELDTPHAFMIQYIRSGDLRFFKAAEEAARHYMDIDTCHYNRDKKMVGMVYAHCLCHVGDYYPDYYRKEAIARGLSEVSHTWTQGLLDYYFLTGYRRAFETAIKIAERYDRYYTVNYDFTNCRNPGWHLILTVPLYEATGDDFYLNAAKIIVRRVLERQTPNVGGWLRQLAPGHCHCLPRHRGNAAFMVGVLLSGLKLYHQVTGDRRVAESIVKAAEFMIRDMWVPEEKAFRYTSCPKSHLQKGLNHIKLEGISYAYRLSGKEIFKEVVLSGIEEIPEDVGFGKTLSSIMRVAPYILYDIENYMMEKR